MNPIDKIMEACGHPCIVVTPRSEGGLTVIGQSDDKVGHSQGLYTRYDYGFMQLDIDLGINIVILP